MVLVDMKQKLAQIEIAIEKLQAQVQQQNANLNMLMGGREELKCWIGRLQKEGVKDAS